MYKPWNVTQEEIEKAHALALRCEEIAAKAGGKVSDKGFYTGNSFVVFGTCHS